MDKEPDQVDEILFFDTEITENVEAVGGWEAAKAGRAGLSAAVVLAEPSSRVRLYDLHTIGSLWSSLNEASHVVSFNGKGFDFPLVSVLGGPLLAPSHHLDLLELIVDAVDTRKGWSLDATCQRTIGRGKLDGMTGALAPVLARQGRFGELFDYCLADVYLTRDLFEHIREMGYVVAPNGDPMPLKVPEVFQR